MSAADRRQVQAALRRLGYDPGPVDGIVGPLTRAAIRRFQQDRRDKLTGSLTGEQASRLIATPDSVGHAEGSSSLPAVR